MNDGGAAFPMYHAQHSGLSQRGMTKREVFAVVAMHANLVVRGLKDTLISRDIVYMQSREDADALLAELERKTDGGTKL